MPTAAPLPQLKEFFNAARYRSLADALHALAPDFDRRSFLERVLHGIEDRSLMERMRLTAAAVDEALPGTYRRKLDVLRALAPRIQHGFVAIFLAELVARAGLDDFETSMEALRFFTRFGSAEFAIREFIARDRHRTLAVMEAWAHDPDESVRRLASEGCRPRLPWGRRLPELIRDPAPIAPVLERLKDDPSLSVRKSVANNLNDIAKDHPDWVLDRLESWDRSSPRVAWIAGRAARTLIKRGVPRALHLLGAGHAPEARAALRVAPARLRLGASVELAARIASTSARDQRLVVDYVVHYVKARGGTSPKVFKWSRLDLPAGGTVVLKKRQTIRDFSTRRHFAGRHVVELQVNGRRLARAAFGLQV